MSSSLYIYIQMPRRFLLITENDLVKLPLFQSKVVEKLSKKLDSIVAEWATLAK